MQQKSNFNGCNVSSEAPFFRIKLKADLAVRGVVVNEWSGQADKRRLPNADKHPAEGERPKPDCKPTSSNSNGPDCEAPANEIERVVPA